MRFVLFIWIAILLIASGCRPDTVKSDTLFRLLPADETGIQFSNLIKQTDSQSILQYMYFYNGGGVGLGDINNDGLTDIFLTGNMVSSKLYLNKGNLKFQDITAQAGIATEGWCTGVAFADVNSDGYMDIYVSRAGSKSTADRANLLFINNRNNSFTESAGAYGIADSGYSTQAAFFDYDKDGDLDLYVLTHDHSPRSVNNTSPIKEKGEAANTDRLYRNEGNGADGHPVFTNVSDSAGIRIEGFGLGVAISDLNADGWPDIYVANDFLSNDILYINNQNGTFTNRISEFLKHESYNGMGVDVADFNNDGHPDIVEMDMLPPDNYRQKMMSGGMTNEKFELMLDRGYHPQYMRNTLQLNDGAGHFSEIGQLAGVDKTDWSWSPLFADLDNDGFKDLFITNGYLKDITDKDFINYSKTQTILQDAKAADKKLLALMDKQPGVKLSNYAFVNNHDLTFSEAKNWGMDQPGYSNGSAFADLDNDGDLDLVVNNINDKAFVYQNKSEKDSNSHYLQISLQGDSLNTQGLGTHVAIAHQGSHQYYEHSIYRGYQSSVTPVVHFGLGHSTVVDTIKVVWPDGKQQLLTHVPADQRIVIAHRNAKDEEGQQMNNNKPIFKELSYSKGLRFLHKENAYSDLMADPLMPHTYSTMGPALVAGDINGDELDDLFIGGSAGNPACFYLQNREGGFSRINFPQDSACEDLGALLFDADNDNDLDLYVVSGGSEFAAGSGMYQNRLYKNDGKGNFTKDVKSLPVNTASGSCVTAADYDKDGDLDLFVGGGFSPGKYPQPPPSSILENNGGHFSDVTDKLCPALKSLGMVRSALWTDVDNDDRMDLVIVGEWMPITIFKNAGGKFVNATAAAGLNETSGWWNSIAGGDMDNDGDIDYILGNIGTNLPFHISAAEPLELISGPLDQGDMAHSMLTWYNGGKNYPWPVKEVLQRQMPRFGKKFFRYNEYAKATVADLLPPEVRNKTSVLKSTYCQSSYLENLGNGRFRLTPLPTEVQFAPVNGIIIKDVDYDGNLDCLMTGNSYAQDVSIGRMDAFTGLYLRGDGHGNFNCISGAASGFFVDTDSRSLLQISSNHNEAVIVSVANADSIRAFSQSVPKGTKQLKLRSADASGWLKTPQGHKRRLEFYYGSGYLSQSSRILEITAGSDSVMFVDSKGSRRTPASISH